MNKLLLKPTILNGNIITPPSKSMGHRAIICASLSKGQSIISNFDYSDDMIATIEAIISLGSQIECFDKHLVINGNLTFSKKELFINCNESGSTLRFMIPITLTNKSKVTFIGQGELGKRPLDIYYNIFNQQGIHYEFKTDILDLKIEGILKNDNFEIAGNVSSQFISGLMFALPLLEGDSLITLTSPLESKAYLDLTIDMLKKYGIKIETINKHQYKILGKQDYKAINYTVEGDYSQASFFLVANALGNNISINGLKKDSLQGDKETIEVLKRMGCKFNLKDYKISNHQQLKATVIDGSQCPDVIPVLSVAASVAKGTTVIKNAKRLRIKECDRLKAMATELNKLGAKIQETEDGLIIEGVERLKGGEVSSWNDHRIAMSLAIASTICQEEVIINQPECVKKSYPNFWKDFEKLGGKVHGSQLG
jgi:3-phosphoshikimate 1-carboxyvinyltransferase